MSESETTSRGQRRFRDTRLQRSPSEPSATADVDGHFSAVANTWTARYAHPSFQVRWHAVRHALASVRPGTLILDFGGGTGVFAAMASAHGADVVLVDRSLPMVSAGKRDVHLASQLLAGTGLTAHPTRIHRVVGDLDALAPSAVGRFDIVLAIAVIEYLSEPAIVIGDLLRLLRPGGRLILTVPDERSLFRRVERPLDHAAAVIGRLIANDRLRTRAYSSIRPRRGRTIDLSSTAARLVYAAPLALGDRGLRRFIRPTRIVVLSNE